MVRETDGAGIRVIDELDSLTVERFSRTYADELVDGGDIRRIANGMHAGHVDQAAVATALTRASDIASDGHEVQRVRTANDVNSQYGPGYEDPYASGSLVVEYRTQTSDQFVRVHQADNQARSWMMRGDQIEGMNPTEIQQKFSLPEKPVYVSEVYVSADTNVRTGTIEANFGGERGAMQFELRDRIPDENFQNQ
ncbi:hypothetical protein AArcMg_3294 [Natrarchaeobaculum sulfurireducens]|uniref:Uncharacterized protein n=1 Tax=Natrarchaeobaculum sulfurireducens TaxID=2044521 RepID=A0A346PUT3_9EURY|nr:hypothetical protein AArcMg_3294 [Natrarchaeobaculum sulfurireducens]